MDDGRLTLTVLLYFYGELLTEKQRECCELYYNEDLSLSEIAEQSGISRQGVWDNIRRAESALREFEEKTGLIRRLGEQRKGLEAIREKTERLRGLTQGPARDAADEVLSAVNALIGNGSYGI